MNVFFNNEKEVVQQKSSNKIEGLFFCLVFLENGKRVCFIYEQLMEEK